MLGEKGFRDICEGFIGDMCSDINLIEIEW